MTAAERLGYRTDRRPVKMWDIKIPPGDAGIAITIAIMRMAAQAGAKDPAIRELALRITRGVNGNDSAGEIDAIYNWVQNHIAFRGEWDETIQAPEVSLRFEGADCDCQSVLMASLLGSLGYTVDFKTVASDGQNDFSHVYVVVWDSSNGQWKPLPLDTTVGDAIPGWEPPGMSRWRTWTGVNRGKTGQIAGGLATMRGYGWRTAHLGQADDGSDQSPSDQIANVIDAADPIVITALTRSRGTYTGYYGQGLNQPGGQFFPQQTGPGITRPGLQFSTSGSITQKAWFWPSIALGVGAVAFYAMGRRGR